MARKSVCIVCFSGDAHAQIVSAILKNKLSFQVDLIHPESCQDRVSLFYNSDIFPKRVDYDVIWIRRKNFLHLPSLPQSDINISLNCAQSNQDALHEFLSQSGRKCINDPNNALLIENKATQLKIASQVGLAIPATLVSSSYRDIIEFYNTHSPTIVKSMRSLGGEPTGTFDLDMNLISPENCSKSFAIYQEKIEGTSHLRIAVFGQSVFAFHYESTRLDSRFDARNNAELIELDSQLRFQILQFMEVAGLKMGVFDFKKRENGSWSFLEVNQQGAFAYLDPLTGVPILFEFAKFLAGEASNF